MSRVAVLGAGTMGCGIAHVFAQYGWTTVLSDVSGPALEIGRIALNDGAWLQAGARGSIGCARAGGETVRNPAAVFAVAGDSVC